MKGRAIDFKSATVQFMLKNCVHYIKNGRHTLQQKGNTCLLSNCYFSLCMCHKYRWPLGGVLSCAELLTMTVFIFSIDSCMLS